MHIDYGSWPILFKGIPDTLYEYYFPAIQAVQIFRSEPDENNELYCVAVWHIKPKQLA